MMATPIRVALADDHTLFREGVRELLSTAPGVEVVGEASSGPEALALAATHRPDVLLLDVEMPGPGAAATIRQVRGACPHTQIIVLTMHDEAELVRELFDCGAAAYLLKTVLRDELAAAVRSVVSQSDTVLLSVSRDTVSQLDSQRSRSDLSGPLTAREREVLTLTARAFSNAQIARRLHISQATVKRHLTNIYAKLHAVSRVDAVRKATTAKLIRLEDESPAR